MAGARLSRRVIARFVADKLVAQPSKQSHWMKVLAAYLVEQNRVNEAELILSDIEHELYEQSGQLLVNVTSARPLSADLRTHLARLFTDRTHAKQVALTEEVDPELVGGFVARTADAEMDASVRTTLNRLATIN